MMRIVICDDDKKLQEILKADIDSICRESGRACEIQCCSSGKEMLRAGRAPDLLFLDIKMPGQDGMETAEELRRLHWDTVLVFVTAWPEYVYDAFDVGAFHYLLKPFRKDKLRAVFLKAVEQWEKQGTWDGRRRAEPEADSRIGGEVILVKRGGVSTAVPVEHIMYAEVFNRKVTLHTTNGTVEYYGKLTELSEQVGDGFYRTHRAYLVNLHYVEKYDAATIWLKQGTVPVAKKQFAGFVRAYMHFISKGGAAQWTP